MKLLDLLNAEIIEKNKASGKAAGKVEVPEHIMQAYNALSKNDFDEKYHRIYALMVLICWLFEQYTNIGD